MIIQHNITSMNANRQLGIVGGKLQKSTEKLASGYRINRAADDAAGLSISEKMRSQVRGLQRASDNAQDGVSLIQTAEGSLQTQENILQRARELMVQSANDVNTSVDRAAIQKECEQLAEEFTRIQDQTEFNGMKLLNGDFAAGKKLQVGANEGQTIDINITKIAETGLTAAKAAITDNSTAGAAVTALDADIKAVSELRSELGAVQNRLEFTIDNDDNAAENLQAAESRIRDVDMADEMTKFSKESILQQAATSMLAQANQANQGVLSLLQ